VLRVGDLEVGLVSRRVSRHGREITLLPREFQLLEYLVRNEGRVAPRAMLLQHVWDIHFDPTTNITPWVSKTTAKDRTTGEIEAVFATLGG
jgi:two-component system OmpR family response regulator